MVVEKCIENISHNPYFTIKIEICFFTEVKLNFKYTLTALLYLATSMPSANAYLSINLSQESVNYLLKARQDVLNNLAESQEISSVNKVSLMSIPYQKGKLKKEVMTAFPGVIDLSGGNVHQPYHMTLINETPTQNERAELLKAFALIEFRVNSVSFMGKFIALGFDSYTVQQGSELSDSQKNILERFISERPHVSLYKITDKNTLETAELDQDFGHVSSVQVVTKEDRIDEFAQLWGGKYDEPGAKDKLFSIVTVNKTLLSKFRASLNKKYSESEISALIFKSNMIKMAISRIEGMFRNWDKLPQIKHDRFAKYVTYTTYKDENGLTKTKDHSIVDISTANFSELGRFVLLSLMTESEDTEMKVSSAMCKTMARILAELAAEINEVPDKEKIPIAAQNNPSILSPVQWQVVVSSLGTKLRGSSLRFDKLN